MSWHDIPPWTQGAVIGASIWLVYLVLCLFAYYYTRKLIEDLGSSITPYLYASLPTYTILAVLILLSGGGALLGLLSALIRKARQV